tara:strand:+ start:5419 stop:7005 length:1587 start_codon:yes stop_codon:yes gene_type:complete
MPGGNVLEDFVLNEMERVLKEELIIVTDTIKKQFNRDEIPRVYEQDLLARLNRQNYKYEIRDGFTNKISEDLMLFGRKLISRTDGLLWNYVVEAKVPFGKLYKKYGTGTVIKEDGTKEYDKSQEIFEIPIHYKLQMLIQMNCYDKKKGIFGQYYIFENWKSFTDLLKNQCEKLRRGAPLMPGTTVYKPCLDKTTPILTIIDRIAKVIQRHVPVLGDADSQLLTAKEKRERAQKEKAYRDQALADVWEFIGTYGDYRIQQPVISEDKAIKEKLMQLQKEKEIENTDVIRQAISNLKIQMTESYNDRYKTAVEEVFRRNPKWLDNIINNINFVNLDALVSNPSQKIKILDILEYGNRQDMIRGVVTFNGNILWDGQTTESPMPEKSLLIEWIKDIFRIILPRISRKDPVKWKAFEDEVVKNNILNFELYPSMNSYGQFRDYGEYNELVILEMNLTKIYDEAIAELKEFLHQCDRTVKYRIACKTRKKKDPLSGKPIVEKMTGGDIGYREKFMKYLKAIPVKLLARREVQF